MTIATVTASVKDAENHLVQGTATVTIESQAWCLLGSTAFQLPALGYSRHQYTNINHNIIDIHDPDYLNVSTDFLNIKFCPNVWQKGTNALWEEINLGQYDAIIDLWGQRLATIDRKLFIALHHEPVPGTSPPPNCGLEGCPDQLVKAVGRFITRVRAAGGGKHLYGQCLLGSVYGQGQQYDKLWLGTPDIIGVDAYGQDSKPTPDIVYGKTLAYAKSLGLPLVIFETNRQGAVDGDGKQPAYYSALNSYLKANKEIIGCAIFDGTNGIVNSEGYSVLKNMILDPYYVRDIP